MRRQLTLARHPRRAIHRAAVTLVAMVAAATLACPTHAAGNSRLTFSSMRDGVDFYIYLVNPDGSDVTRVTQGAYGGDGAALSPDGTRIIYESPRRGYAQLYMINVDGSNEHRILGVDFYEQSGTWSPEGARIAFTHSSTNGSPAGVNTIWVFNADGTSSRRAGRRTARGSSTRCSPWRVRTTPRAST